jgi:hypothetical protein
MELSLKEFKERLYDDLIELHWKHWTALGVASHVKPEKYWIIDLEPLIISTLTIGLYDKRLLSSSIEWLIRNGEWMNLSRLKRILKSFMEPFPEMKELLITPEIFELLVDTYNKNARNKINCRKVEPYGTEDNKIKEYKSVFNNFRVRGIVTEPKLRDPSLLQILLRGFFGIDAHVETLIYLLVNDGSNSNFIAKEIFYNQRNIYNVLERWKEVQIVAKIPGTKAASYYLIRKKELLSAFGLKGMPKYLNWSRTFMMLDRLAVVISTPPLSEDEYLLSSLFRDLSAEAKSIGRDLDVKVPDSASYLGKKYFGPFALGVLNILKQLRRSG